MSHPAQKCVPHFSASTHAHRTGRELILDQPTFDETEHTIFAQVMHFKGPRTAELLDAADRAGQERLGPIMMAHPKVREDLVALLTLRQPDGTEMTILVMRSAEGLDLVRDLVMSAELLPGEDVALMPGPDQVDRYTVTKMIGWFQPAVDPEPANR